MRSSKPAYRVKRMCGRLLLAVLVVSWWFLSHTATATGDEPAALRVGVNRVNLAWLSRQDQEKILKEIAASGAGDVRLSLSRPVGKSIEALEIANQLGLRILLEIQLTNKSYYPEAAQPRTGHGRTWDIHRLSDLDLDLYRKGLREALQRIDDLGIKIVAIEPGNEINLGGYNGDLLIYRKPGARTPRSVADLKNRAAFERGLDRYIAALDITKEEIEATTHSRDAIIVSAGLSDMSATWADQRGMERLDPAEVIALLRERGLDRVADAYGIHIYAGRKSASALDARVERVLEFCRPTDVGKPCWVTEWGVANADRSCPTQDRGWEASVRAMREAFDDLAQARRLDAIYYYDWDTQNVFSLWRCGTLSPAGEAALDRNLE